MGTGRWFASVLFAGAAALAMTSQASAEQELHVLHAGGQWGDAITKCVENDMAASMGIKVIPESPGGLAKLRGIVESGNITHTAFDMETSELVRARQLGLIQPIDWAKVILAKRIRSFLQPIHLLWLRRISGAALIVFAVVLLVRVLWM